MDGADQILNAAQHAAQNVAEQVAAHVAQQVVQGAAMQNAHMAANAAQHVAAMANTHRELAKQYKPEKLDLRRKDTQRVQSFIFRIEKYFRMIQLNDDALRVEVASFQLDGDVALWWRTRYEQTPMTWSEFVQKLREQWCDEHDIMRARSELRDLKQVGSAQTYTAKFDSLCLRIPDISETEKCDRYLYGLKPAVQKELLCNRYGPLTPLPYKTLTNQAELIDGTLYEFRLMRARQETRDMEIGTLQSSTDSPQLLAAMHRQPNGRFRPKGRPGNMKPRSSSSRDMSKVRCYNCQQMGHFAATCKNPKVQAQTRTPARA